ncbi:MAG: isoprenylcysteine carboxylmethyltransferase family protein [Anaerolineae bacterium]
MRKDNLIALLHALSGAVALIVGLMTKGGLQAWASFLKPLGFAAFVFGMLLFAYAVLHLRRAFQGNIQPVTENLIKEGPYRIVRHPLYLGMIISIAGLALGMRSMWGLITTFVVFLPLTVLRARLEETALHKKFGITWEEYTTQTYFIFPLVF